MGRLKSGKSAMVNRLVFGGWAIEPEILAPVFGDESVFIDTNAIVPLLFNDNVLLADWQQKLVDIISSDPAVSNNKPFVIAGWSTGAILAWTVAERLKPAAGVFLSATPSFCRRRESGYLYGQKSSVLRTMREHLLIDPDTVVNKFCRQCGILAEQSAQVILRQAQDERGMVNQTYGFSAERLISGLRFLEQASILPLHQASFPALFLHGKGDSIIPIDAGRYFCNEAGGTFAEADGSHAFFLTDTAGTTGTISDFLQKVL